ncbi:glucokinase [Betaproteobacteria bacterium]|nr:glucokinase [Betaproteobacteria bacterium]
MSGKDEIVLAADIGGSRARLLLAELCTGGWRVRRGAEFASADYPDMETLIGAFVRADERPVAACLAVAGPLAGQRVQMTNLAWALDGARIARHLGISRVRLVNDFAAQGAGLACVDADGLCTLCAGQVQAAGVKALIGAGTGLGMAVVAGGQVLGSEGGHVDFAPRNQEELALLAALLPFYPRVSLETLLSGAGMTRLYRFVAGLSPDSPLAHDAATIGALARDGDVLSCATLRLFARLLAAAAGNLALTVLADGGVYLSGGIVPRILPFLRTPEVVDTFHAHPRMAAVLEKIPLYVVTDEALGLRGAAQIAAGMARDE